MNLRTQIAGIIQENDFEALTVLVDKNQRSVRPLVSLSYAPDKSLRLGAAKGLALASRNHPKLIVAVLRRLIWAMNDESGTNAVTAPDVVQAIAEENPSLLLPFVPDLVRLSADESLYEGLAAALRTVSEKCPGEVGKRLGKDLNRRGVIRGI